MLVLREVPEDEVEVAHGRVLVGRVRRRDGRGVLTLGEESRGTVRRVEGEVIHLGSVRGRRPGGVAVNREEDVGFRRVRGGGAVIETDRRVGAPRRDDAIAAALEDLLNRLRERERRVFLEKAAGALRPLLDAAMPRIENYGFRLRGDRKSTRLNSSHANIS